MVGQQTLGLGHVDLNQAVHRCRSFAGPNCGGNDDDSTKRSHFDLPWAPGSHGTTLPRTLPFLEC
jgi:hypothetical protein